MKLRIAIAGMSIESCTFSPMISGENDFQVLRGEELLAGYGFLDKFEDVDFIPVVRARAIPGGPVDPAFFAQIKSEIIVGLKTHTPLDGVFLQMHGAMNMAGMDDAEGDLLAAIREAVGEKCLLSASYDLHANVSLPVFNALDILSAYRHAPHIDWYETLERACTLLVDSLRTKRKPKKALVRVPILLSGEQTSTEWEPAGSLYRKIPKVIENYNLLDASINIGYVWADEPRSMATVLAYGENQKKANQAVTELAQTFWNVRMEFSFGVPALSVDKCIREALKSDEHPVIISDSGDNPTAGGVGDIPFVLERMLALKVKDAVVTSIPDPAAVEVCVEAGVGAIVELEVGGKLDPVHGKPLKIGGEVLLIETLPWSLSPAGADAVMNTIVVLGVNDLKVVLTQQRTPFHRIEDFTSIGIDPYQQKTIVVKIGYLVPELKALAAVSLLALSPGAVSQDILNLDYRCLTRPMFPFEPEMEWEPDVVEG